MQTSGQADVQTWRHTNLQTCRQPASQADRQTYCIDTNILHCVPLHYMLRYVAWQHSTFHYIALYCIAWRCVALHCITYSTYPWHYMTWQCIALQCNESIHPSIHPSIHTYIHLRYVQKSCQYIIQYKILEWTGVCLFVGQKWPQGLLGNVGICFQLAGTFRVGSLIVSNLLIKWPWKHPKKLKTLAGLDIYNHIF